MHCSEAVAAGLVEPLRWRIQERHSWRFFYSVVMVFKTGAFLVTGEKKNVYLCTYAKYFFFFCCWGQSQCAVCYSFSWQCCNGNKQTKKRQKCVTISPEDARSKTNCHCVVFNMDSVWMFLLFFFSFSGERLLKSSIILFVTVVLFLLKSEYCVLYCRNPENKVAKQAIIYSSMIPVCVFSCSVLISQRWSLSLTVSASLCVV